MDIVYKIRRSDGLFSKGGSTPRFSKKGKSWPSKAALNSHLSMVHDYYGKYRGYPWPYDDCVIVEFEMVEGPPVPVNTWQEIRMILKEKGSRSKTRDDA